MSELIIACVGLVTSVVSGWAGWFFTRKKYNTEVDSNVIENMKQSLEFYIELSDDNKERLEEALKRNAALEDEVKQLRDQMFTLMSCLCYDMSCELRKKQPVRRGTKRTKE